DPQLAADVLRHRAAEQQREPDQVQVPQHQPESLHAHPLTVYRRPASRAHPGPRAPCPRPPTPRRARRAPRRTPSASGRTTTAGPPRSRPPGAARSATSTPRTRPGTPTTAETAPRRSSMPAVDFPATGGFTIEHMHIGEVARRAGLSVKTVRYYSDLGLVPEAGRTLSGYRRYDGIALVRLEFVRTLRELGLDLATIRKVLERDADLPAVAAAHAEALSAQIRVLRIQRAALRTIARRDLTQKDVERMNRIAQATADERRRILEEFLDSVFGAVEVDPALRERAEQFQASMRRARPDLPDDPTDEQVDAWIELAELVRD